MFCSLFPWEGIFHSPGNFSRPPLAAYAGGGAGPIPRGGCCRTMTCRTVCGDARRFALHSRKAGLAFCRLPVYDERQQRSRRADLRGQRANGGDHFGAPFGSFYFFATLQRCAVDESPQRRTCPCTERNRSHAYTRTNTRAGPPSAVLRFWLYAAGAAGRTECFCPFGAVPGAAALF